MVHHLGGPSQLADLLVGVCCLVQSLSESPLQETCVFRAERALEESRSVGPCRGVGMFHDDLNPEAVDLNLAEVELGLAAADAWEAVDTWVDVNPIVRKAYA